MSMKRSPQWYEDHQAKMRGLGNVELVTLERSRDGVQLARPTPKLLASVPPKEPYPNLLVMFAEAGIYPPVTEYIFAGTRKWRFDYAWPVKKVALEIDGGAWTQGRHTRGAGFIADQDKRNAATILGWRVIHRTPDRLVDAVREVGLLLGSEAA